MLPSVLKSTKEMCVLEYESQHIPYTGLEKQGILLYKSKESCPPE